MVTEVFGESRTIDLIANGRNVDVSNTSKFQYVGKMCNWYLHQQIIDQIQAFRRGFYDIVDHRFVY